MLKQIEQMYNNLELSINMIARGNMDRAIDSIEDTMSIFKSIIKNKTVKVERVMTSEEFNRKFKLEGLPDYISCQDKYIITKTIDITDIENTFVISLSIPAFDGNGGVYTYDKSKLIWMYD